MRKPNYKLSEHFSFHEFIEGEAIPTSGHEMNWKHIGQCNEAKLKEMAEALEPIRKLINVEFQDKNNGVEIGLNINAGWRCLQWELSQKRSGKSQHVIAAADVYPTNVSDKLSFEILEFLYELHWPKTQKGWRGGFAVAWPKPKGKFNKGFVHYDLRGSQARWLY